MTTVAKVRKGQTYMSYKGEHQTLTIQSIRQQVSLSNLIKPVVHPCQSPLLQCSWRRAEIIVE